MKIILEEPLSLNKIGQRVKQEDYIMPQHAIERDSNCFVICDGLGGHGFGDTASRVVAESVYGYIADNDIVDNAKEIVGHAIEYGSDILDRHEKNGEMKGMGTTIALLLLSESGYLAAHIGDSRIYHIRQSELSDSKTNDMILYKSWDHSLVNLKIMTGELSEEDSINYPYRNVLIKAMQCGSGENRPGPQIYESADVKVGDYFLLCSDGVCGCIDDSELCDIITEEGVDDFEKISKINATCNERSKDNYSCWLLHVKDVQ